MNECVFLLQWTNVLQLNKIKDFFFKELNKIKDL